VLPAGSRLHTSDEFAAVVRLGRRAASPHLVVHLLTGRSGGSDRGPRVGFVVSAKVGNAVIRHRVTRRLRALVRQELTTLPTGTDVVVRALPSAASASGADLGSALRGALSAALRTSKVRSDARPAGAGR
jgi:ribonuclease P protein component